MKTKEQYIRNFEAQLNEWNAKIEFLQAAFDEAENRIKKRVQKEIDSVRKKHLAMGQVLLQLRNAGDEDIEAAIRDTADHWFELKLTYLCAYSRFK
jgi:predicted  nucleic acid-binding Zn-ribbon protein